jgi:hypothetical protein
VLAPGLAERRPKLTSDPNAPEVRIDLRRGYRAMGLIYEKMGRFQAADEAFAKVIDLAPAPPDGPDQRVKNERHLIFGALIGRGIAWTRSTKRQTPKPRGRRFTHSTEALTTRGSACESNPWHVTARLTVRLP